MAQRSALLPIGIHLPGTIPYESGFLQHWLDMLGAESGEGMLINIKLLDEPHRWLADTGFVRQPSPAGQLFLAEGRALGFKPFIDWNPWSLHNPLGADFNEDYLWKIRACAHTLAARYPDAILSGPGNEPNTGAWNGTDENLWTCESYMLKEWNNRGHECAGFSYSPLTTTVTKMRARARVWQRYDCKPDWWHFHAYGQGGAIPRNVADMRKALKDATGIDMPAIYGEYHYGFPGQGSGGSFSDRPDLLTAETGHYVADMALKMLADGSAGTVFTLESMFFPNADGTPNAAGLAFAASYTNGSLVGTPRSVSNAELRTNTYRIISENHGPFWKIVRGVKEVLNLTYP